MNSDFSELEEVNGHTTDRQLSSRDTFAEWAKLNEQLLDMHAFFPVALFIDQDAP